MSTALRGWRRRGLILAAIAAIIAIAASQCGGPGRHKEGHTTAYQAGQSVLTVSAGHAIAGACGFRIHAAEFVNKSPVFTRTWFTNVSGKCKPGYPIQRNQTGCYYPPRRGEHFYFGAIRKGNGSISSNYSLVYCKQYAHGVIGDVYAWWNVGYGWGIDHLYHVMKYHDGPVVLTAHHDNPLTFSHVDMTTIDTNNNTEWVKNSGGNVPYTTIDTSASDFNETSCAFVDGKNWCYWKDNLGDCMNVPTTGTYAFFIVASSCPAADTAEEWARISVAGGWALENRHTGEFMNCENNCISGDNMVVRSGVAQPMNFPAS